MEKHIQKMFKKDIYTKTGISVGAVGAALTFVALFLTFRFSNTPFEKFSFFSVSIPITSIFLTSMYFRATNQNESFTFAQSIKMSWWNLLITATLFSSFYAFYISTYQVEFMAKYVSFYENFIRNSEVFVADPGGSEQNLQNSLAEAKNMSIAKFVVEDLKNKIVVGSLASLVVAIILRK